VTRAADIISSDDDFDDMMVTYAYGQGAPAYQSTPAASEAADDAGEDPDDPDPSLSESGEEEEDDDDDFVAE
jgi:ribosomal protein L12E/L44/L45/RPP1/RPP2